MDKNKKKRKIVPSVLVCRRSFPTFFSISLLFVRSLSAGLLVYLPSYCVDRIAPVWNDPASSRPIALLWENGMGRRATMGNSINGT